MPSKKAYDLVSDDGCDNRIPLHNEEAFQHGLEFQAKFIGTLDVPRPSSRVEIVAAMRRIRYEFKAKSIKKKKVILTVSIEGVKVTLRKKQKSHISTEDSRQLVTYHPIYRIFYVSHDSQDLKIWSYIARDGASNVFKCNVFKSYKKSQAMRIVRTIGQAFEVCHKLGDRSRPESFIKSDVMDRSSDDNDRRMSKNNIPGSSEKNELNTPTNRPNELNLTHPQNGLFAASDALLTVQDTPGVSGISADSGISSNCEIELLPLSQHYHVQLVRQQLEQQHHETQVAIAQVHLLKDQLSAETAARIEAQARVHQLLLHNKDLLEHVSLLVTQIQHLEMKVTGIKPHTAEPHKDSTQVQRIPGATMPRPFPSYLPELRSCNSFKDTETMSSASTFANTRAVGTDTDSPDSGHKEMSSESLSYILNSTDAGSWINPYGICCQSSQDQYRHQSNIGWITSSACYSTSPASSSPSRGGTLKAGSTSNLDFQIRSSLAQHVSQSSADISDSFMSNSSNFHNGSSTNSPQRKEACDKVKLISPLASPSASKTDKIDYKPPTPKNANAFSTTSYVSSSTSSSSLISPLCGTAPKLDPPPKYRRTARPIERWERGSWYGSSLAEPPGAVTSENDYSMYMDGTNNGGVTMRSYTRDNSTSSGITMAGTFNYSESNARSSLYFDNTDTSGSVTSPKLKLEHKVNNLRASNQQHQQQQNPSQRQTASER